MGPCSARGDSKRSYSQETHVASAHFYPDPSDPCPMFMLGQIDLDETEPTSLGEVMLSVRKAHQPAGFAPHIHHHVSLSDWRGDGYMFGTSPEQPFVSL